MRIDKYLAASRVGSRSEVKDLVRKELVYVNGKVCKDCSFHVSLEDEVCLNGQNIRYTEHVYYMLNKPAGYVSATEDEREKTVLDLFPEKIRKGLFPVGRLDKDSVGLLLLTDDGELAHRLMSPKHHVDKRYLICTKDPLTEDDVRAFSEGIVLSDGTRFRSAGLEISEDDPSTAVVTISEGKFHQIKRMVESRRNKVRYLKRLSVGTLMLDPKLKEGMYRELTDEETGLIMTI
ncbi:MAG: 16S rRNA pseudouridine(516) synthase [Lachnospiraceae bacterium]|nr:16S rRNA pseudouridine(516) synthase [Lachnospiraceae bacterium]